MRAWFLDGELSTCFYEDVASSHVRLSGPKSAPVTGSENDFSWQMVKLFFITGSKNYFHGCKPAHENNKNVYNTKIATHMVLTVVHCKYFSKRFCNYLWILLWSILL